MVKVASGFWAPAPHNKPIDKETGTAYIFQSNEQLGEPEG